MNCQVLYMLASIDFHYASLPCNPPTASKQIAVSCLTPSDQCLYNDLINSVKTVRENTKVTNISIKTAQSAGGKR